MHDHEAGASASIDLILAMPFVLALVLYCGGVAIQRRGGRGWPWRRSAAWFVGVAAAAAGFVGPLAAAAHDQFVVHMWVHLLVGMTAPLLLVVAAPVTLALRSLPVTRARVLSRMFASWPARIATFPIFAAVLNVGGLWVLYLTPLYIEMQRNFVVHVLVMTHLLLAGYLFTVAIIPMDPAPHRAGFLFRTVVLVLALAAHSVLAKLVFAHPPAGVSLGEGQAGAMLMYYTGGLIDAVLVAVLCAQWYRDAGRRLRRTAAAPAN